MLPPRESTLRDTVAPAAAPPAHRETVHGGRRQTTRHRQTRVVRRASQQTSRKPELQRFALWMLRYAYPAGFLAAGLLRSGSVFSAVYGSISLFLTCRGSGSKRDKLHKWMCLHYFLMALMLVFLVGKLLLLLLITWLGDVSDSFAHHVKFGSYSLALALLPEVVACLTSAVGAALGKFLRSTLPEDADSNALTRLTIPVLQGWPRRIAVGVLLLVCVGLDCNIFALIYFLASLVALVCLAVSRQPPAAGLNAEEEPQAAENPRGATQQPSTLVLRAVLGATLCCHVLAIFFVGFIPDVPKPVYTALGLGGSVPTKVQCFIANMLLQLLVWSAPSESSDPMAVALVRDMEEGGGIPPRVAVGPESMGIIHRSAAEGIELVALLRSLNLAASGGPSQNIQDEAQRHTLAGSTTTASAVSWQADVAEPFPMGSASNLGRRTHFAAGEASQEPQRLQPPPEAFAAGVADSRTRFQVLWSRCKLAWRLIVELFNAWFCVAAREFLATAAWRVLPLVSLMVWPVLWPSLITLPLLGAAMVIVHLDKPPKWTLLYAFLIYEVFAGLVLYSYNVLCNVSSTAQESPDGPVPVIMDHTWSRWIGMHCFAQDRGVVFSVAVQCLAPALLSVAVRCAQWRHWTQQTDARLRRQTQLDAVYQALPQNVALAVFKIRVAIEVTVKWMLVLLRVATVVVLHLLSVTHVYTRFSALGFGYMMWNIILTASGYSASYARAGWDGLLGHACVWRWLLIYAQAAFMLVFLWQIFGSANHDSIGLYTAPPGAGTCYLFLPHLGVAFLASLELQAFTYNHALPFTLLQNNTRLGSILRALGIYSQMVLMFVYVAMLPEASLFSLVMLVLFILVVATKQFGSVESTQWLLPRLLLAVAVLAAGLQLPGYLLKIPGVANWISYKLKNSAIEDFWHTYKPSPDDARGLGSMALLIVHSSVLCRIWRFCEDSTARDWLPANMIKVLAVIRFVAQCSAPLLLFAAWFLTMNVDVLSRFQSLMVLALLWSGRGWHLAGALLSISSLVLLLVQYLSRFGKFAMAQETLAYWGFEWNEAFAGGVLGEITVLICSIIQGQVEQVADTIKSTNYFQPEEDRYTVVFRESAQHGGLGEPLVPAASPAKDPIKPLRKGVTVFMQAYGAHLSAMLLLLLVVLKRTVWTLFGLLLIVVFMASGASAKKLERRTTAKWVLAMSSMLGIFLLFQASAETWLPPGTVPKPTTEEISQWGICRFFADYPMDLLGARCSKGKKTTWGSCETQQQRCAKSWKSWTSFDGAVREEVDTFLIFFMISLLHRLAIAGPKPVVVTPEELAQRGSLNEEGAAFLAPSEVAARPSMPPSDSSQGVTAVGTEGSAAVAESPGEYTVGLEHYAYRATTLLLWSAMTGMLLSRVSMDAMSVGYLVFLFLHMLSIEGDPGLESAYNIRVRTLQQIRWYNIIIFTIFIVFQNPVTPCPFKISLPSPPCDNSADPACDDSFAFLPCGCKSSFMTGWQCEELQKQWSRGQFQVSGPRPALGVLMQCMGFYKLGKDHSFQTECLWSWLVFCVAMVQMLICSRWEGSLRGELIGLRDYMAERQRYYEEQLKNWRRVELRQTDCKQRALRVKLQRLRSYMTHLRAVWGNRAKALTQEEEQNRLLQTRVDDICLDSGASEESVRVVLKRTEADVRKAIQPEANQSSEEGVPQGSLPEVRKKVDELVVKRLRNLSMLETHRISPADAKEDEEPDLQAVQTALLEACREVARLNYAGEEEGRDMGLSPGEATEQAEQLQESVGAGTGNTDADAMGDAQKENVEKRSPSLSASEAGSGCDLGISSAIHWFLALLVDDGLFARPGDATIQDHRRSDNFLTLFLKAMWSRTFCLVFLASVLQFSAYRSLLAAVTSIAMVVSLMCYPHPPLTVWLYLQRYNWVVVVVKLLFQLPIFCYNGSIDFRGCWKQEEMHAAFSWHTLLGLMKVKPEADSTALVFSSLADAIWADILVIAALALHYTALALGGRLGNPGEICRSMEASDRPGFASTFFSGDDNSAARVGRWSSFPEQIEMEAAASSSSRQLLRTTASEPALLRGDVQADEEEPAPEGARVDDSRQDDAYDEADVPLGVSFMDSEADGEEEYIDEPVPLRQRFREVQDTLLDFIVGHAILRKPTLNLYRVRLPLAMVCVTIVLLSWPSIVGKGRSFTESLTSNSFSGPQALALVGCILLIALDRALYTWYTQGSVANELVPGTNADRGTGQGEPQDVPSFGAAASNSQPSFSPAARDPPGSTHSGSATLGERPPRWQADPQRAIATTMQKVLLWLQLLLIHIALILQLATSSTHLGIELWKSSGQFLLYFFYMAYLVLTSLQLRYDVHVVRGGLHLTHSTDMGYFISYRIYTLIPFIEEFRVLIDWTVTKTSMNLFMWMKLEDAHQSLYKVACDMEFRRYYPPGSPRPFREKFLNGFLFVVGLLLLVVGPIVFFSTANLFLATNYLTQGRLTASLEIRSGYDKAVVTTAMLYQSGQSDIKAFSESQANTFSAYNNMPDADEVANITFPMSSDIFWVLSPARLMKVSELLAEDLVNVTCKLNYELHGLARNTASMSQTEQAIELDVEEVAKLRSAIDSLVPFPRESFSMTLSLGDKFRSALYIDSSKNLKTLPGQPYKVNATLNYTSEYSFPYWSIASADGSCESASELCPLTFTVGTAPVVPVGGQGGSSTWSVVGLYLGVVYTIGRFLRIAFQDGSKRMIYEELPDTKTLQDLCSGIYIARIQGNIKEEWELYHALIRIYRSPELLMNITNPKDSPTVEEIATVNASSSYLTLSSQSRGNLLQDDAGLRQRRSG